MTPNPHPRPQSIDPNPALTFDGESIHEPSEPERNSLARAAGMSEADLEATWHDEAWCKETKRMVAKGYREFWERRGGSPYANCHDWMGMQAQAGMGEREEKRREGEERL